MAVARYTPLSLCSGDSLVLRALAVNADTFYWELNGKRLNDSTSTLSRKSVTIADSGLYTFIAVNGCNSDTAKVAHVSVSPGLRQQVFMPNVIKLCKGDSLKLAVSVDNAVGYRWFSNGVKIAGAVDSTYSIVAVTDSDTGLFVVQAYNACSSLFDTVRVSVSPSVEIISRPRDTSICRSVSLINFTVNVRNEDSIVWYFRNMRLDEGATLTLRNLTPAYSGYYRYEIYGKIGCGATSSSSIVDSVWLHIAPNSPILLAKQPDLTLCRGKNLTLELSASNLFRCTWTHNGRQLPQTGSVFTKPMEESDTGFYYVEGYNGCGSVFDTVHVAFVHGAKIRSVSADTAVCRSASAITFTVSADDADSVEWYFKGALAGRGDTLRLTGVNAARSGYYVYVVYDRCSNVTDSVRLFVSGDISMPRGSVHSMDSMELCLGDDMLLTYTANNVFRNRWYHNGVLLSGAADTMYVKQSVAASDEGWYVSEVYNGCNMLKDSVYVSVAVMPRAKFVVKPADTAFCGVAGGATVTFSFSARDYDTTSIRWYHNGNEMLFAQDTFITVAIDAFGKAGIYRYEVISDGLCRKVVTDSVELAINAGMPAFKKRLGNDTVICGSYLNKLSVSVSDFFRNRWYYNDSLVSSGRDTALYVSKPGKYKVISYNGCGAVADSINVRIYAPARVLEAPKDVKICFDYAATHPQQVMLTAAAGGDKLSSIRWYHDSVLVKTSVPVLGLNGVARDTLTITISSEADHREGSYYFVVSSSCGEDTAVARLDIGYRLGVTTPLAGRDTACEGAPASLNFAVSGAATYRWYRNVVATPIAVADSGRLIIPSVALRDSGLYIVVADNGCYSVSDTLHFAVRPLPVIIEDPNSVKVRGYAQVLLVAKAVNAVAGWWQYNGKPLLSVPDGSAGWRHISADTIVGELHIWRAENLLHDGAYRFVVSNGCGVDSSSEATVTVVHEKDIKVTKTIIGVSTDHDGFGQKSLLSDTVISVGDYVTYRITVSNRGGIPSSNVQLTDLWSTGVEFTKVVSGANIVAQNVGSLTFALGAIAPDSAIEIDVRVRMREEGFRLLSAYITDDDNDTLILGRVDVRVRVHGHFIYPTTITPNGDGHNDYFEIPFALSYPNNHITIFNRTGNMVYTKKGYYNEFNAEGLPDGTYYYIFVYVDENGKRHRLYGPLWVTRLY
jgi:gliding motility-associated-like protein/uncharacterized repeat protein (TIGR01451 family)